MSKNRNRSTPTEELIYASSVKELAEELVNPIEDDCPFNELIEGVVANCKMLNVRVEPNKSSKIVTVLNSGDSIAIDLEKSTDEWYRVTTTFAQEGFCMKKFIVTNTI